MGALTRVRARPVTGRATRVAVVAVVASLVVVAAVAVLDGSPLAVVAAAAGSALVAVGLVAGLGAAVVVGGALQLGSAAGTVAADAPDSGVRPVALILALLVWATVELACSSLDRRPDATPTSAARVARASDLLVVGLAGLAIGATALLAPGADLDLPVDVRLGALAATALVLALVWSLSRWPRSGGRRRPGPSAPG